MGVGFLHAGGRWGSCPTLPYGELRLKPTEHNSKTEETSRTAPYLPLCQVEAQRHGGQRTGSWVWGTGAHGAAKQPL